MKTSILLIVSIVGLSLFSCSKTKDTQLTDIVKPKLNSKAILSVFINESSNESIKIIEEALSSTDNNDHKSKADYYNLLSYIYKSNLNYTNFIKYNKLAKQSYNDIVGAKDFHSAILLNTIKSYYEMGNDASATELISTRIDTTKTQCESKTIRQKGFFYLEYAYLLALNNNIKKAQEIIKDCSSKILAIPNIKSKFKKNVYFYSALISSIAGDMDTYSKLINKYKDLTPDSLGSDQLSILIANICSYYKNNDKEKAQNSIKSYSRKVEYYKNKQDIEAFKSLESQLRKLVKKNTPISKQYGHWHRYCNVK